MKTNMEFIIEKVDDAIDLLDDVANANRIHLAAAKLLSLSAAIRCWDKTCEKPGRPPVVAFEQIEDIDKWYDYEKTPMAAPWLRNTWRG